MSRVDSDAAAINTMPAIRLPSQQMIVVVDALLRLEILDQQPSANFPTRS